MAFYPIFLVFVALLLAVHFYAAGRVVSLLPLKRKGLWTACAACLMLGLFFLGFGRSMIPMPDALRRILGNISASWMGMFLYLVLFFLAADAVVLILRFLRAVPHGSWKKARKYAGAAALALALAVSGYGFYHAQDIQTPEYEIRLTEDGEPFTVALLSDLHLGAAGSEARLEEIIDAVNGMDADIVLIAGDLFDNDFSAISDPDRAAELMGSIASVHGVYACFGNHDAGSTEPEMLAFLASCGVTLLRDEYQVIDERFVLVGRCDPSPIGGSGVTRKSPEEVLSGIPEGLPVIVMDHNPENLREYDGMAGLVVSGHTHRGQVFPGSLITRALYPTDYGYYRAGDDCPHLIVTSGAGTWGPPMRVGTDAEVVKIELYQ